MLKKRPFKTAWPLILVAFVTLVVVTACLSPESPSTPTTEPPTLESTNTQAPLQPTATQTEPPPTETALPEPVATVAPPVEGTLQFDFEDGAQGWGARGEATVSVVDDVAHSGAHSLLVTNRTAAWHGVALDVSGLLQAGNTYEIGGYVRLAEGAPASRVIITMQRTPSGGDTVYEWIAPSAENGVTDGEWVHLQGQYSFSGEASELLLYVESPDAELVDFYIDEMTICGQTEVQIVPIQTDIPSVYETLAAYFPVGAALGPNQLDSERHTALLTRHFNSLTPENTMKPGPIQPSEGNFAWANVDRLVEFAQAHTMAVHGHTLVWHQQAAEWMFLDANGEKMTATPENKELLLKRLEEHIRAVVGRYKDAVNVWDVVNEVIDPARPDCMRHSMWYEITGVDYIVTAFRVAREVDPDAILLLNDYNTYQAKKRECIYSLVSDLQEQGAPIDGIGMQMHIDIASPSIAAIETTIERFAELGEVHITELDMSVYTNDTTSYATISDEILLQQGYRYRDIFEVLKRHADSIGSVTFWGLADDTTWLKTFPIRRLNLPLLFDEQLQAKYAYWGVVDPSQLPEEPPASGDVEIETPRIITASTMTRTAMACATASLPGTIPRTGRTRIHQDWALCSLSGR